MAVQHHADIIAVSYEARALGVTKHMPTSSIRRQHPSVKLVHVEVNPTPRLCVSVWWTLLGIKFIEIFHSFGFFF